MKYKVSFVIEPNRPCDLQYIEEMSEVIRYELNQQGDKVKDICIEEIEDVPLDHQVQNIIHFLGEAFDLDGNPI